MTRYEKITLALDVITMVLFCICSGVHAFGGLYYIALLEGLIALNVFDRMVFKYESRQNR